MRRGLTRRMAVASGLLATLVSVAFVLLLLTVDELRTTTDLRRQTREELVAADAVEKIVIDIETGLRGFVITREERFLDPWREGRAAFPAQAREFERLTADDPGQLVKARRIVKAARSYIDGYSVPLVSAVRGNDASARSVARTVEGKRRVDALRGEFDGFARTGRGLLDEREASAEDAARRATIAATAGVGGSILLIILFSGYLARVIVRPLRRAAQMANELAGGDLSTRMPENSVGEIGALERSFNAMAGSLEASEGDLRRLVEQQAALRRVATLVARTVPPAQVFEAVTREVGLLSRADLARMERFETDGTVTGVAAWGGDGRLAVGTRIALEGVSIAALVQQTGRAARVDSFADLPGSIAAEARAIGIRSSVGCPIVVAGRIWGVIAASTKGEAPFPADTESQIAEFTELVATAIANAESRAEVAASRARIVAAADDTRRRIERDLHDGTQQRLVSLGLELRLAQLSVPAELTELHAEIGRVADELDGAIEDLREISRGIHPAILSEGGLGPALRTLARRSAVPVELDAPADSRFPAEIEVAAYYVVSEALTNTTKHARASRARVVVEEHNGTLQLSVSDDGIGGAEPVAGSGLLGLRDRVEALGGTIRVSSPHGEGTLVVVELPVHSEEPVPAESASGRATA
jgi:signal transduction histidine kinase